MKVGWLHTDPGYVGGAELTMAEFRDKAPKGVEFTDDEPDVVVIGNCTDLTSEDLAPFERTRVVRYHHDLARAEHPAVRDWLDDNAEHVFTSPLHQQHYGYSGWENIPPALDLRRPPSVNGERVGTCSIAAWMNPGKGGQLLREFSDSEGPVDIYGEGPYRPQGENLIHRGALEPDEVAHVLALYERFVFLPSAVEPFGRCVVEAWAAGCEVLTNDLVGARYYLEHHPKALQNAAQRFWDVVCG